METFRVGRLSHVAVLVRSVEASARVLAARGLKINPAEKWDGEGALEIYVGDVQAQSALLLLMQPTRETSHYHRALEKRGPGLHHLALNTETIQDLPGWILHKKSSEKLAYYKHRDFPALIEMQRYEQPDAPFITRLEIPCAPALVESLRTPGLFVSREGIWFEISGQRIALAEITGASSSSTDCLS
jgi:hypothetical protein